MTDAALLASLLTKLRLPSIVQLRIADTADRDGWPAQKTIAALMGIEVAERTSRRTQRHRDQSEAPAGKTFASFDFDAAPRRAQTATSAPRRPCGHRAAASSTKPGGGHLRARWHRSEHYIGE
ncbi:hypothetical protein [Mesorhizobium sp. M1300]|uniref:hypothetical protein n=1 Tax=Mesorhizobium sp. M1300 TaxID=2957077 RepID=UPI003339E5EB